MKWGAGLGDLTLKGRLQVEIRTDIDLRCLTAALWGGGVWIGCHDCFKAAQPLNKSKYDCVTVRGEQTADKGIGKMHPWPM